MVEDRIRYLGGWGGDMVGSYAGSGWVGGVEESKGTLGSITSK